MNRLRSYEPIFYEGWNFNFGNTSLDWIQELLEWRVDDIEGVGDDEIVLLEIQEGEGEDLYVPIEDEKLLDAVFETFQKLLDEEEDEELEDD